MKKNISIKNTSFKNLEPRTLGNLTFIFIYQLDNSKRNFFLDLGRNEKLGTIGVVR